MDQEIVGKKEKNWICYQHKEYPNNKLYITSVDKKIIDKMPSLTETYVERNSILKKIKKIVPILFSF